MDVGEGQGSDFRVQGSGNTDRHVRNKLEGVNRARGEALETVHHLHIAMLKGYLPQSLYQTLCVRYTECVKMLNGLEKALDSNSRQEIVAFPTRLLTPDP
jgi:hypothetical protein